MTLQNLVWIALSIFGVVGCLVFIIGYHIKSGGTWRRYPVGRDLMGFPIALGFSLGTVAGSRLFGPLGAGTWIVVLTILDLAILQRVWVLFATGWHVAADPGTQQTQHAQDDERRDPTMKETP